MAVAEKNSFNLKDFFFFASQLKKQHYNFHIIQCRISWMLINFRFNNHDNVKKKEQKRNLFVVLIRLSGTLLKKLKVFKKNVFTSFYLSWNQ